MDNKKTISILMIFTIIFTVIGGSLAFWNWNTSEAQRTNVVFTMERDFSCAADGGGNITETDVTLAPTDCTDTERAIQRTVKVTPTLNRDDLTISMDLWLDVNDIGDGLSASENFKFALTKSANSCTTDVVSSGSFFGKVDGSKVKVLDSKTYTATLTETYYLYIWLDKEETSSSTMNQTFDLSLSGSCSNAPLPEAPVLDTNGMIPVTISSTGVVKTVSEDDANWYDYSNKEWANAVLVSSSSRSNYLNSTGKTVNQDDILGYYVWIPRYSYMVPDVKCSEIVDPTLETHPGCYTPPFKTSGTDDVENMAIWWQEFYTSEMGGSYTLEQATADVQGGINTGMVSITGVGSISMLEFVMMYNEMTSSTVELSGEFNGSNVMSGVNSIEIAFEETADTMAVGNGKTSYRTHPAFWWDNDSDGIVDTGETVAGIWVGKFETSANTDSTCYTSNSTSNCLPANVSPRIVPNVKSLRYQNISNQFATSQKFTANGNAYGLSSTNTNAHMMKNSEWGAVAYLSHSAYGINQEIYINNSFNYFTGRSGGGVGSDDLSSTSYGNYTWLGQSVDTNGNIGSYASDVTVGTYASTTGNVTGVYDMSGGSYEYVMGVLADSSGKPRSGNSTDYNSGFNGTVYNEGADEAYTLGVAFPASKYYDLYMNSDPMTACNGGVCYGHALSETANWYNDYAYFVNSDFPWFMRGGRYGDGAVAGAFYFGSDNGYAYDRSSWRSVLVVGYGA